MSRRKKGQVVAAKKPPHQLSGAKLWCLRLISLLVVPLLFFSVLEFGLRLVKFGYPTSFLQRSFNHGANTFVQNNQFGWRFFGPRAARVPFPTCIRCEKPPDTIRIFVFGESAAYGDPQPRFGLPRMLQATLELRHPDKKFEVVNAAMTGINSHVIRELARDCAPAEADVWVIYMGNNEVIGPFGVGTVFGNHSVPLPLIRAQFALKRTRLGQLLDSLWQGSLKDDGSSRAWEGLRAFSRHKLSASDPQLAVAYRNFRRNLGDILATARGCGARVVLCTVAVNLRDCAPFASVHSDGLSESQLREWERFFNTGANAQASEDWRTALANFDQAARIDDSHAELRFRRGQCLLALGNMQAARAEFVAARDLDALRFRCDSSLNQIIREQALGEVVLLDAERAFAEASPDGIPGGEFFFEHVHLTAEGNYLLARLVGQKMEELLGLAQGTQWPEISECMQRLGYTERDKQLILSDMLGRLRDVPFTFRFNNEVETRRLVEAARALPLPDSLKALRASRAALEAALARWPYDAVLWEQLAEVRLAGGDLNGAFVAAQQSIEIVPSSVQAWLIYGLALAQVERYEEARAAFYQALTLDPEAVWARHNLALCLEKVGRHAEAVAELQRVVAHRPEYGTAWLTLGQFLEKTGRTNEASQCFARALANPVNQLEDLLYVARFCLSRGWYGAALTNFTVALERNPHDPGLHVEAGRALEGLGRVQEALQQYQAAIESDPSFVRARMLRGIALGKLGEHALAEKEFREALQLDPDLIEARVNLGVALYKQQRFDEAVEQFEEGLRRNPKDPLALHYISQLRARAPLLPRKQ